MLNKDHLLEDLNCFLQYLDFLSYALIMLKQQYAGTWDTPVHNRPLHMGVGAAIAGFLYWACLAMPKWPLHPVGLLLVWTEFSDMIWASAFVGWSAKVLIVFLGGARGYSRARAFFLGLVFGEVLAGIVWGVLPLVRHAFGASFHVVRVWSYW